MEISHALSRMKTTILELPGGQWSVAEIEGMIAYLEDEAKKKRYVGIRIMCVGTERADG